MYAIFLIENLPKIRNLNFKTSKRNFMTTEKKIKEKFDIIRKRLEGGMMV